MGESHQLLSTFSLVVSILLILSYFGVIGVVLYRFKTTAAGLLLAIGYGAFALMLIVSMVVSRTMHLGEGGWMAYRVVSGSADFLFTVIIAIGIGFIPKCLRSLRR